MTYVNSWLAEDNDQLLRRLVSGDERAETEILERVWTVSCPTLLVAAGLIAEQPNGLLARAARHATTAHERQLVALATARLSADEDRLAALTQDHLGDHPDSVLATWITTRPLRPSRPRCSRTAAVR